MTPARLLLALFAVVLAARVAAADDAATRSAKRHFDRAQKLYAVAKFRDALDEYQKAFEAKPLPDFLFNIGQCHRNLGDYDAAIFSYKKYLTSAPGAANRAQVEQLIDDLQTKRDQEDARRRGLEPSHPAAATSTATTAPPPPQAPPPERPIYGRWWFWTALGVAVGTGGIVTYEATRSSSGPPATALGNIVFGK
jgi:tetratricopeptide (TPR) repeat protein